MAALEIILFIIVICLFFIILKKVSTPSPVTDSYGQVMTKLGELKTVINERSEQQEKLEKKRDEFQKQSNEILTKELTNFTRLLSGTKERGNVGENLLKEVLNPFIKSGKIITNLNVDNKTVEFAWKLAQNKFIPIDSKLPDVINVYKEFCKAEEKKEQLKHKKEILHKIEKHIDEVKKYRNKKNTTNKVIIAIPDAIFEMVPEINSDFERTGIIVVGYQLVSYVASYIEREYIIMIESGEVGDYKELLSKLMEIINGIKEKSESIERGVVMIRNANDEIKKNTIEAEACKPKKTIAVKVKE